jgi:hypothetical protein
MTRAHLCVLLGEELSGDGGEERNLLMPSHLAISNFVVIANNPIPVSLSWSDLHPLTVTLPLPTPLHTTSDPSHQP